MERQLGATPQGTALAAAEVRFTLADGCFLMMGSPCYSHLCLTSTTLPPPSPQVTNGPIAAMGS